MSPFQIRREPIHELCLLIDRLNDHSKRNKTTKNGEQKIRRKAGDTWF